MGLFDRLFGRKPAAPASGGSGEAEAGGPTDPQHMQRMEEFARALDMQGAYWTHDPEEMAQLEARGAEHLDWCERLRLHHLICLQRLNVGPERADATEKCRRSVRGLTVPESPFRPRVAMIWQGQSARPEDRTEPDLQGEFMNPSLTHLGCLEVYRLDATNLPTRLDFVGIGDLAGVVFAPPSLIRAAKLFYDDGREEVVLVPMLYGLTSALGNEHDRAGQMTRFVAPLNGEEFEGLGVFGMGVGQQDFSVRDRDGDLRLFGVGSVSEIEFPLDMRDPQFDAKARARGIDPEEIRRSMGGG